MFDADDNLLVCDVGGGTTDLSVLKVVGLGEGVPSLKQLDVVVGRNIGSVKIDEAFENLILQRLQDANEAIPLDIDIEDAAWLMMKSREYQNAKCDHGSPAEAPLFFVPVPGLPVAYHNPSFGLGQGAMLLSQDDIRGLFDSQINLLHELIDRQLSKFERSNPGSLIHHLVLSGGLGNSAYIQSQLHARYAQGATKFVSARGVKIHVAPDPQLAVAKGIVHDRVKKLVNGQGVLGWRCARASYGTVCKILYDPFNPLHKDLETTMDPFDKKLFVMNAIQWFIKKVSILS